MTRPRFCALFYYHELFDCCLPPGVTKDHCVTEEDEHWFVASSESSEAMDLLLGSFEEDDKIKNGYGEPWVFPRRCWVEGSLSEADDS